MGCSDPDFGASGELRRGWRPAMAARSSNSRRSLQKWPASERTVPNPPSGPMSPRAYVANAPDNHAVVHNELVVLDRGRYRERTVG